MVRMNTHEEAAMDSNANKNVQVPSEAQVGAAADAKYYHGCMHPFFQSKSITKHMKIGKQGRMLIAMLVYRYSSQLATSWRNSSLRSVDLRSTIRLGLREWERMVVVRLLEKNHKF
jgi:hypothetical protein